MKMDYMSRTEQMLPGCIKKKYFRHTWDEITGLYWSTDAVNQQPAIRGQLRPESSHSDSKTPEYNLIKILEDTAWNNTSSVLFANVPTAC